MQQLESEAQACPDLILTATSLQALQIKGVGFAEMFASFGDVNNFCGRLLRLSQIMDLPIIIL